MIEYASNIDKYKSENSKISFTKVVPLKTSLKSQQPNSSEKTIVEQHVTHQIKILQLIHISVHLEQSNNVRFTKVSGIEVTFRHL